MTPEEYCQEKAAQSGSSFYYSFLFLPSEQRRAITALYAFCREVDDVVDECSDVQLARIKLNWWRTTITKTFEGAPEHPVQKALMEPIKSFNLPLEYFLEIIDGMEMDLDYSRYPTFKDLSLYCYRAASVVGLLAAEIFGYQDRRALKYAYNLGMAFQLTNILRDVREDAALGRIYLPLDELKEFGVTENQVQRFETTDAMRDLFEHQSQRAHNYYKMAFNLLPEQDRYSQRTGLIMAAIYQRTLKEIEAKNYSVLEERISLTPIRKLWLAWMTARQEKRRHQKYLRTCHG